MGAQVFYILYDRASRNEHLNKRFVFQFDVHILLLYILYHFFEQGDYRHQRNALYPLTGLKS